jgi:hypothetical protein
VVTVAEAVDEGERGRAGVGDRVALHRAGAVHDEDDVDRGAPGRGELAGVDAQADLDLAGTVGGEQLVREGGGEVDEPGVGRGGLHDDGVGRLDLDAVGLAAAEGGEGEGENQRGFAGGWRRASGGRSWVGFRAPNEVGWGPLTRR